MDFPRSQQHALHRTLFLGRLPAQVNYLYFFSRLTRSEYREALAQDFHRSWATFDQGTPTPPWRRTSAPDAAPVTADKTRPDAADKAKPATWETVWHDLLEISDFVIMPEDAHNVGAGLAPALHKEEADAIVSR